MRRIVTGFFFASLFSFTLSFSSAQDKQPGQLILSRIEQQVLDMTNEARKKENLAPLKADPVLTAVARAHSANMARQDKLDHVLDDKNPFQRLREAGYSYYFAGENIAVGIGHFPAPMIFANWMESKFHRDNILKKEFTEIGVGIVTDAQGKTWYTQVFGQPKPKR